MNQIETLNKIEELYQKNLFILNGLQGYFKYDNINIKNINDIVNAIELVKNQQTEIQEKIEKLVSVETN